MSAQFLPLVRHFLASLDHLQGELQTCFIAKRVALKEGIAQELQRLNEIESGIATRLQSLIEQRSKILAAAGKSGLPNGSITELATAVGGDDREALRNRIANAEQKSRTLQEESWVQWIIAHRRSQHFNELIELIAHCGQEAPTYNERPSDRSSGGAILDASI